MIEADDFCIADKKRADEWDRKLDDTASAVLQLGLQGKSRISFLEQVYRMCEIDMERYQFVAEVAKRIRRQQRGKKY